MAEIKVLFVTSEIAPLIKTGGLADVSGALPAALRSIDVDVRVLVPGYPQVMAQLGPNEVVATFTELPGFPPSRMNAGSRFSVTNGARDRRLPSSEPSQKSTRN